MIHVFITGLLLTKTGLVNTSQEHRLSSEKGAGGQLYSKDLGLSNTFISKHVDTNSITFTASRLSVVNGDRKRFQRLDGRGRFDSAARDRTATATPACSFVPGPLSVGGASRARSLRLIRLYYHAVDSQ